MHVESVELSPHGDERAVERYYRFHAGIYDITRWSFLFGRSEVLRIASRFVTPKRILEVGCGTGRNLAELGRRFPTALLTGVDLSPAMLEHARRRTAVMQGRVELLQQRYAQPLGHQSRFDLVLFSYSLTMFNPGFERAIGAAWDDLASGGCLAVVDFHDSPWPWFLRWMRLNHVRIDGQLRPLLAQGFTGLHNQVRCAYGGIWRYLLFVGTKIT